jgi:hypothetical protein
VGQKMGLVIAAALFIWFGIRFWWTGRMMPAGMVCFMSLMALALLGTLRLAAFIGTLLEKPKTPEV